MRNKTLLVILSVLLMCGSSFAATPTITLPTINGSTLTGTVNSGDYTGMTVTNLGDIDGDFYPNIAIGSPRATPSASYGRVYLINGLAAGFPANVDLNTASNSVITGQIAGQTYGGCIGEAIVNAGDLDGDKLNETVLSSRCERAVYILFGSNALPKNFKISDISTTIRGVKITGIPNSKKYSIAVGDLNKDKKNDLVITSTTTGDIYVINGSAIPTTSASIPLVSLLDGVKGANFITPHNSSSINKVTILDVNRDGFKDIVAANITNLKVYGILGRSNLFPTTPVVNLNDTFFNGVNGFTLSTSIAVNASTVSSIGDVNNDNFEDFALRGEQYPNRYDVVVVFGKAVWPATENLSSMLNGIKASTIVGAGVFDTEAIGMSKGGDFNNDNIKDFMIGDYLYGGGMGRAIIVFGRQTWPASLNLTTIDGVSAAQIVNSAVEYAGASVEYGENLFGGIGCGSDTAYLIGAPGFGNKTGKVYIVNIKK